MPNRILSLHSVALVLSVILSLGQADAAAPAGSGDALQAASPVVLKRVKNRHWDELHVRRVLRAFAWGGHATDNQVKIWANMKPHKAVAEILTFEVNNDLLSPDDGIHGDKCGSLSALQAFWSSDDPDNPMVYADRYRYAMLNSKQDLSLQNLQRTWTKVISTRGCNPFLHKTALFLTNYHASIHAQNTKAALIRAYYDDYVSALAAGKNFIELMTVGASHAAVARAYGHQDNRIKRGVFYGNEDFAREYLQLFFGIPGTTEDTEYYENVSIKNNALVLTGMNLDKHLGAYGAAKSGEWWVAPIVFTDHVDETGRNIRNASYHYENALGEASCLEVLHEDICGATAAEKLEQLGWIAGTHAESMANIPVNMVRFFADDNLDSSKIEKIRGSWAEANFDPLAFIRAYAASRSFHDDSTFKYLTAFDRNLIAQNASILDNEENFAKPSYWSPYGRMNSQGVRVFEPIRNVFGHQTGTDAANNAFIFKDAFRQNSSGYAYHVTSVGSYTLEEGGTPIEWIKDWGAIVPANAEGQFVVSDVAEWLWQRFIGDGGRNFDVIARAQVQSLLATGRDFGYEVDSGNPDPEPFYSSSDIEGAHAQAAAKFDEHAAALLDFATREANEQVGMAINFITMTPYAFAMEGQ